MAALKRLSREHQKILEGIPQGILSVEPEEGDFFKWRAKIMGPPSTPYEGGIFQLKIFFPSDYPFHPPKVIFETRIFHPNISSRGDICLDILRDKWSAALTVRTLLLSICSLLDQPNPDDPLVAEIANLMKRDPEKFKKIASLETCEYAK